MKKDLNNLKYALHPALIPLCFMGMVMSVVFPTGIDYLLASIFGLLAFSAAFYEEEENELSTM